MNNSFQRFNALVPNHDVVQNKHVMIVGVGGVGGFATEAIARCGIKKITIIDKDIVDETNLNRQIIALNSTIGRAKVEVMKERLLDINPNLEVRALQVFLDETNIEEIIEEDRPDYVIDCIDSLKSKIFLLKTLYFKKIKFISSMGTAKKFHPELLEVNKLSNTSYDPIAKKLRKELKDLRVNIDKVKVVYSKEIPANSDILGSTSFVPSSAGLLLASFVVNEFIKEGH